MNGSKDLDIERGKVREVEYERDRLGRAVREFVMHSCEDCEEPKGICNIRDAMFDRLCSLTNAGPCCTSNGSPTKEA